MPIQKSIFTSAWTTQSSDAWGRQVAALAGYDAGQPSRTFAQHGRLGSNPNSVNSQIERVRMEWNAEWLAKNSALGIGYIRQRLNYCSPLGWMPNTGDASLNGEIRSYIDDWMEDGGMNCSAYDSFARIANVQLPVRGDSSLVWMRDESRLRVMEAGGDQIGELNVYGNPTYISNLGLTYFSGMYFDNAGSRQAFRIYSKGSNDYYFTPNDFPSSDVMYFQDNLFGGVRGVTIFHGTIKTLSKSDQLFQFGMDSAQKQAKTGVVVRNEQGGPMGDLSYDTEVTDDGNVVYIERTFDGAQTQYQYNGDSYEVIKTDAPGQALIDGCEYADERSCLSLGFPFSFLVNARDVGGAPSRLEISKAGKEVERLRRLQGLQFKRMMYIVIMDAVQRGEFRGATIQKMDSARLTRGTPKFPNLPTADAFRETQDDIASNRAGIETRASILSRTNEDWPTVLSANRQEAMDISMAVQDANRLLAKRLSPVDFQPYEGDITAADVAQNSDNPQQSAAGEAIANNQIAPNPPGSGKGQVTDNPPNITRGVFSDFDESKHPRSENGEFGSGVSHSDVESGIEKKYPGVSLNIGKSHGNISISKIVVPKEMRGSGTGSKVMDHIAKWADENGHRLTLTPSSDFGGNKSRLVEFYKRFGFVENKGKSRDLSISDSMYREPNSRASLSAYIGDILAGDLPQSTQSDISNILGTNGTTGKLKLIKYGMVPSELEKMADAHNLESAQKHIRNMPNYACSDAVHGSTEKHVLIQNNQIVDGHHFLAKALKGNVTKSLPVIDLTPSRFQGAALKEWDENKHPRAEDGEFGSGGSRKPTEKPSARTPVKEGENRTPKPNCDDRCQRAKSAHVMVDKRIQRYAEEHNEPRVAKALGGVSFPDGEPIDIAISGNDGALKHGVELKTIVKNSNGKITMKGDAIARKAKWERKNKAKIHTIVIDDSEVFNANGEGKHDESKRKIYYANGYGSFRIATMHQAKDMDEVKSLMNTPYKQLPEAAKKR